MVTQLFQWRGEKKRSNKKPLQAMLCMVIKNQSVTPWSVELLPVLRSEKVGGSVACLDQGWASQLIFSRGGAGQGQKSSGRSRAGKGSKSAGQGTYCFIS